ncbi:DUF475 domain-containing protein [Undibacterium arcticum]
MEAIEAALTLMALVAAASLLDPALRNGFIEAGVWGVITFILAKGVAALLGGDESGIAQHVVKQGIGGFLYLELIDASFFLSTA